MENLRPILSGVLGALVAGLLMAWVARGGASELRKGHVCYGARIRAVAVLMLAIAVFIAYAALHASPSQRVVAFFVAAPLLAGSVWFVVETFFVTASVSTTHLTHRSPWSGTRSIPWSAVTGYEFSSTMSWHVLETSGYGKVRLSSYMLGVDQVAEYLAGQPGSDA